MRELGVSKNIVLKALVLGAGLLSLVACAEKPKPVIEPAPVPAPQPKPVPPKPVPPAPKPVVGILPGSMQDFVVNVGDRVYFDTDQSSIRPDAKGILDAQAAWLVRYSTVMVRIEGNADERGTREYNFALGERRAEAVKTYLMSKGVPASRISTISYGKENPIDTGSDESAWAKNRNAHTALTSGTK